MAATLETAREDLNRRQGKGARYDAPIAPAQDLALARLGTAYFARSLSNLMDADLDQPSRRRGWSRRQIIAQTGYHARFLAQALEQVGTAPTDTAQILPSKDHVALGATLPARALRHLVQHSAVHLNVTWRDLGADVWDAELKVADHSALFVRDTALLRARLVWGNALALGAGGRRCDVPPVLLDAIDMTM